MSTKTARARGATLLWALIHGLLALLAPLLVLALGGCADQTGKDKHDYGPEIPFIDIKAVLGVGGKVRSPLTMKVGEFVHYVNTQELGGTVSNISSEVGRTVVNRAETAQQVNFTIIQHKIIYGNGETRKLSTEFEEAIRIASESSAAFARRAAMDQALDPEDASPPQVMSNLLTSATQPKIRVTFHNLRVAGDRVAPPELVQRQTNCLGIPDCLIQVFYVGFDQVVWTSEAGEKTHYEFQLSPDVPYLAGFLNQCMTFMVTLDKGKTLAKLCSPVVDFRFESPPPAPSPSPSPAP